MIEKITNILKRSSIKILRLKLIRINITILQDLVKILSDKHLGKILDKNKYLGTIISHVVCWLMATEKEMSAANYLKLGLGELYFYILNHFLKNHTNAQSDLKDAVILKILNLIRPVEKNEKRIFMIKKCDTNQK